MCGGISYLSPHALMAILIGEVLMVCQRTDNRDLILETEPNVKERLQVFF
jgi:hypothetical protein